MKFLNQNRLLGEIDCLAGALKGSSLIPLCFKYVQYRIRPSKTLVLTIQKTAMEGPCNASRNRQA